MPAVHAVEALHRLSQLWYIIHADLVDFDGLLAFLLDIRKMYDVESSVEISPRYASIDRSVDESLTLLMSRNRIRKQWIVNYNDRTKIRINLFFNLALQSDNQANLDIANLTSQIALATQRDSSSMIT